MPKEAGIRRVLRLETIGQSTCGWSTVQMALLPSSQPLPPNPTGVELHSESLQLRMANIIEDEVVAL